MKNLLVLLAAVICGATSVLGQDILYLKNGSIIKGELLKVVPNGQIQIQQSDGSILSYNSIDAIMINKEDSNRIPEKQDIISLTDGNVIRGYLVEYTFGKNASIKTSNGSLFVYNTDEIAQVTKEKQIQNSTSTIKEYNYSSSTSVSTNTPNEYRYSSSRSSQLDDDMAEINRYKARKGYRGFASITPSYYISNGIGSLEISTTHGFQINHYCFVGGGIGVDIIGDAEDYLLNSSGIAIPIYAAFSGNVGSRVAQFTYGTRIGSCIWSASNILSGATSLMWNVNVGLRLGFTPTFGLSITPDFSLLAASNFFDARVGLRIGVDF